jgi:outer membrane protein assembly factor BamB
LRWDLAPTCLLSAWLGTTALASATPTPQRAMPVVRWQLPLPGWGEPAADDSTAYFLTRTHEVVSVDAATGSIRWRSHSGGAGDVPTGTQVRLASARVVVGDGGIVSFDRASGRLAWRFEAPDGDDPGVFLGTADADLVVAGSPMGRLYALDAVSGAVRWTRDIANGKRRAVFAPVHVGPLIVASFTTFDGPLSGGLVGFDRRGRRRWTYRFGASVGAAGPPVVLGNVVAVARTDGHIEVVRPTSGRRVWMLGPDASSPGGVQGRDIRALASHADQLVATSLKGPIRAYDVHSRRQRWEYGDSPTDAVALRVRVYGDQLYVPYSDGSIVAVDLQTGAERWRTSDSRQAFDWPPAASATSIFASAAEALWAFHLRPLETAPRQEHGDEDR